jgi:hypothetical protein
MNKMYEIVEDCLSKLSKNSIDTMENNDCNIRFNLYDSNITNKIESIIKENGYGFSKIGFKGTIFCIASLKIK